MIPTLGSAEGGPSGMAVGAVGAECHRGNPQLSWDFHISNPGGPLGIYVRLGGRFEGLPAVGSVEGNVVFGVTARIHL